MFGSSSTTTAVPAVPGAEVTVSQPRTRPRPGVSTTGGRGRAGCLRRHDEGVAARLDDDGAVARADLGGREAVEVSRSRDRRRHGRAVGPLDREHVRHVRLHDAAVDVDGLEPVTRVDDDSACTVWRRTRRTSWRHSTRSICVAVTVLEAATGVAGVAAPEPVEAYETPPAAMASTSAPPVAPRSLVFKLDCMIVSPSSLCEVIRRPPLEDSAKAVLGLC